MSCNPSTRDRIGYYDANPEALVMGYGVGWIDLPKLHTLGNVAAKGPSPIDGEKIPRREVAAGLF
ncbi:MAG: hypothetical protein EOP21_02540 [Hyphomicrobiales bacterium]|nr:MAG: hypothetical protein EOP21_02540 [Hyphomicrobiales bacterium]